MGLFKKKETKAESGTEKLADAIMKYMQSEGFFPEKDEPKDPDADLVRIDFKFQGINVTMDVAEGNYIRMGMVFDLSDSDTDYFNLQCAASQIMFEMKAVKIVAAVKWIQFSVETFARTADAFTPFLKSYLDILSEAVGRHRILYAKFMEDKEASEKSASGDGYEVSSAEDNAMERVIEDAINSQGNKSLKN